MKKVFAPGCALSIYKPSLAKKVLNYLNNNIFVVDEHLTCCRHEPNLEPGTQVINICAGCDRRYRQLYQGITTVSLWEVLADSDFPFPNYQGKEMTILDACPTRDQERVHIAIRKLLERMNINLIEPANTRTKSKCCGDSYYGTLSIEEVKAKMKDRTAEMPCEDVIVYCVSCCKSIYIGGKTPRYLVDLLFEEETEIGTFEPKEWHKQLDEYIIAH